MTLRVPTQRDLIGPALVALMLAATMETSADSAKRPADAQKAVTRPVEVVLEHLSHFGRRGSGAGAFFEPSGIAVDPLGNVFVADTGNDRLQKFDSRGRYASEVGGFGWDPGQFNQPTDVATGKGGLEIYVADSRNSRIQAFSPHLRLLGVVGGQDADGSIVLGTLSGLAVSEAGELMVNDLDSDQLIQISTYSLDDRRFGGFGYGAGQLRRPQGIGVGEKGVLYVADEENNRIAVFDRFGNYSGEIGADILLGPRGVCVGPGEQVYVADTGHNRIVVFDPKTRKVSGRIGEAGSGPGQFREPRALAGRAASGGDGFLYVLDSGNYRVQKLRVNISGR